MTATDTCQNTSGFRGDDEANLLFDRPRRKGFELPEIAKPCG